MSPHPSCRINHGFHIGPPEVAEGGALEPTPLMAAHEGRGTTRTLRLYKERLAQDEVERIRLCRRGREFSTRL